MEVAHEKKGGSYTKDEQRKRLEEVYRLHFEYGYSARKIAEFLKVNRSTINRDIIQWYTSIGKKWRHWEPETYVMNQIERLEIQRTRLRKQLDKVESFHEKIIVEKLILDIDMKITNFQIRVVEAGRNVYKEIENVINEWYEKEKNVKRVFSADKFIIVSKKAQEKMDKIYEEDMKF